MTSDLDIFRGGYVVLHETGCLNLVLMAEGPDVCLALQAAKTLEADGIAVRVVNMPSTRTFDRQTPEYRTQVLPPGILRMAVDTWVSECWRKYVGPEGLVVGVQRVMEAARPYPLWERFETTTDLVVATVREQLSEALAG
nr:transketolase C-terminal domain-containing protein [uncultured Albidiferax sp.]